MKKFLILIFLLASCTPPAKTTTQPQIVTAYSTSAANPWLVDLFSCAESLNTAINISADSPNILLRVGEPEPLVSPAYQVGKDELLVIVHQDSPLQDLTLEEVQSLFSAQENSTTQVWVYASDADMQVLFEQAVMEGRIVTSFAKVAVDSQRMLEAVESESNSVGFILRGSVNSGQAYREVYSAGDVPVLALTQVEASGIIRDLISCISK
ncbi:MAG TPA: hypothetical protein PLF18_03470 [Anaerolineales bacterium]|nr:hypothetical protein [Anaerolineales bacterium]